MFKKLYSAYVIPHLEYAAPAWSPYRKKEIRTLEAVQRRATKLVPKLKNHKYADRLKVLGLTKLAERRCRGDLIQYFKIEKGFSKVTWVQNNNSVNSLSSNGLALNCCLL